MNKSATNPTEDAAAIQTLVAAETNEYDVEIEKLRLKHQLDIAFWKMEEAKSMAALEHTLAVMRENHKSNQRVWDAISSTALAIAIFYSLFGPSIGRRTHSNT
jgi:hypothetical protein